MRRVTLSDVSKAAGVGVATVSRALAGADHPDVNPETRKRVRKVAKELGYRPSATARALRTGAYRSLSVVVPDMAWGWWEPVIRSAYQAAAREGYKLLVHPIAGTEGGVAAVIRDLVNVPTDGVLVFGSAGDTAVRDAADRINLPIAIIDDVATDVVLPTIAANNRSGARLAVEHLISQGRRRIAVLRTAEDGEFVRQRLAGYFDAIKAAGIPRDDRLIVHFAEAMDESVRTWQPLHDLLESALGFDGLFCIADFMAAPAIRTLHAAGRAVPRDVSIVGFDDERAAQLLDPPLTTVRQPYEAMGESAVQLLLRSISGEKLALSRIELDTHLVVRHSTEKSLTSSVPNG